MSALASRGLRTDTLAHGRRARYVAGCRCDLCRAANRNYARKRLHAQKDGDWNGIVDATEARRHLLWLSRQGVGRRAVHAASDVALTVIAGVRDGTKTQIRARTERKILAVTPDMVSDRALVKPGRTYQRIKHLVEEEGFSKAELARRLGYRSPALQFRRTRMTARNVARVEALYQRLTT